MQIYADKAIDDAMVALYNPAQPTSCAEPVRYCATQPNRRRADTHSVREEIHQSAEHRR